VDQQAAAEASLTLFTDALFGGNLVHDVGYLESGLCGSLPQLVICDEILSWLEAFMKGVEITDESLALNIINEIGPDGQHINSDHTLENYKKRWYPKLFERANYDSWKAKGGKDLGERATDQVNKILAEHTVEPLPKDLADAVHAIVESPTA